MSSRFPVIDMMKKKPSARRSYTPEFKADAVRLASVPGEGAVLHSYRLRRGRVVAEAEYVDGEPISAIRYRYR